VPLVYTSSTACMPACCVKAQSAFQSIRLFPIAATDKLVLMCQAVPKPAAEEHSATAADQPCDESLPSANRSGKAKKFQRKKGKGSGPSGSGSRPMLQPPVLCSVLPCLQKLELHITGGYMTSCLHYHACIIMLALLCLHCCVSITMLALMSLRYCACIIMLAFLCFNYYACINVLA
jgi:hypothetical protein